MPSDPQLPPSVRWLTLEHVDHRRDRPDERVLLRTTNKGGCSAALYEIVNSIWDWDFRVTQVSITRQVADAFELDPEEQEREVGIGPRQTRNPIIEAAFSCPVMLRVVELPSGMLMRAEGLLTYPVRLDTSVPA